MIQMILTQITPPTVPDSAAQWMPDTTEGFHQGMMSLLEKAIQTIQPNLMEAAGVSLRLMAVVLLVSIVALIPGSKSPAVELVGAMGIGALLLNNTNTMIKLGIRTVTDMSSYGKLLLPVMTSALAAQGGIAGSTALYAGTVIFDGLLSSLLQKILNPMVYIYLVLCTANSALGEEMLKKLAGFVKWFSIWILKTVLYIFTGYMGITGVISGTTDAATLKAAKLTISGVVPVVGGILSDASEAVLVSAGLVRNAAGIYGIFAILAIFLTPFLRIGCHYLLLKLTGTLCAVFGVKRCTDLIGDFTTAMGLLLAMTGSVCLLQLISTVCFLRGVG